MPKTPITVIILTLNEAIHIERAIANVANWATTVFVLDSGSTDETCTIAKKLGAQVFYRKFDNYAAQRTYAIKELPVSTEWIYFQDADEYMTDELKTEIGHIVVENNPIIDGYYVKWKFIFLGKWIKYGGYYPTWILRLFRKDKASVNREMNEHIAVAGKTDYLKNDFIHESKKDFSFWMEKHNQYSTYEAIELLKENKLESELSFAQLNGTQAQRKRWIREKIWNRYIPAFLKPFIYFFYRYFIRLGFLDGKIGFIYHFMHAFVFYFLVEIKYLETKIKTKKTSNK